MAGLNKVLVIGNLGKDPELRQTSGGTSVANFSVAVTERYNDKSGTRQENVEWINVVLWDKLATLAGQYLRKGSQVYIEGKLKTSSWEDKNGGKRYKTDVVGSQMQFLGSKSGGVHQDAFQQKAPQATPPSQVPPVEESLPF